MRLPDEDIRSFKDCRPATLQRATIMPKPTNPSRNRLLNFLPAGELRRLISSAVVVTLAHGVEVYRRNESVPHVYFPTTAVLGLVLDFKDGKQVEGTTVGKEGMIGLPAFLGSGFHSFRIIAQIEGEALKVPTAVLLQEANSSRTLDLLLRRYTHYRLWSANQTGA